MLRPRCLLALLLLGCTPVSASDGDDDRAEQRAHLLLADLYDRGHLDASVVPVTRDDGSIALDVREGPVYHLDSVALQGDLLGQFPSIGNYGERFSRGRVVRALDAGKRAYRARGYPAVDADVRLTKDEARCTVTLSVDVTPGLRDFSSSE